MKYGIYLSGRAGTTSSTPDDPQKIDTLVRDLAGESPLIIREYIHFLGSAPDPAVVHALGAADELARLTMPDEWYTENGRELDLVVSYLPPAQDVPGWLDFLDAALERYGRLIRYFQVTLEPNFPIPHIDGSSPGVMEALTVGLPHARRSAPPHVQVGFSVAEPAEWLGGDAAFWEALAAIPPERFADHLDYVGLALYPDAFSPVPREAVPHLTEHAVRHLRKNCLAAIGVPAETPIHIAEFGSPSGADRGQEAQSHSISDMLATIRRVADELNVTAVEYFGLRDADTGGGEPVGTLGLVGDDHRPKPSFDTYRTAISENLPTGTGSPRRADAGWNRRQNAAGR